MFSKMIMGVPIPLNETQLYIQTFFEITHTGQVVKYYEYVNDLIEGKAPEKGKVKKGVFVPLLFKDLFISLD